MSRRRVVEQGKWYAVSRRTTRRYFLFTPDQLRVLENAFWYFLAVAAQEHGVRVAAAVLMSTHWHLVLLDLLGEMPLFFHDFGRHFALFVKAYRGWPEEVLNKASPAQQELLTPKAMVEGLAYAIGNGAEAGAVRYARDWPGALTRPEDLGRRVIRAKRPDFYVDPKNPRWPEEVELELVMPEALEDAYGLEGAQTRVAERVHELERSAWKKAKEAGHSFAGVRRTLRRRHTERASSYEVFGAMNPRFIAAGDPEAATAAVMRFRQWNADYDAALAQWCSGNRRVVFPYGTWWMRVHHGVRCRPPPAA